MRTNKKHKNQFLVPPLSGGMTLVELAVVLAIIAVVAGFVVPGFKTLMQDKRFNSASSEVTRAVILARSEAMKRGETIFITAIDGSDTNNEWGKGFRVWLDDSGDSAYQANLDIEIYTFTGISDTMTIDSNAAQIQVTSRGLLSTSITLSFCDNQFTSETGRALTASLSGQISIETLSCT